MLKTRTCPLCEATCSLLLDIEDGRIRSVRGNPASRLSQGYLCAKGASLGQIEDDPDRIRRPHLRRDGRLVPVSWDDAFADMEARLRPIVAEHGGDAVGIYVGNANHASDTMLLGVMQHLIGTKYFYTSGTVDQLPRQLASNQLYGAGMSVPVPDIENSNLLVVIGANPAVSNGSLFTVPNFVGHVRAMQKRGGAMVVVDPRRTRTAELADEHIAIQPGTDPMLLLGLLRVLGELRVDLGHLEPHLRGQDVVARLARSVDLADVERVTGVGEVVIRRLAERLVTAGGAAVYGRIGTTAQRFGTVTSYLIDCVNILSGNLDRTGGAMFAKGAIGAANATPYVGAPTPSPAFGAPDRTGRFRQILAGGFPEYPVASIPPNVLDTGEDRMRAMLIVGANPARSSPDSARMIRALDALDYQISIDRYVNETSSRADVVLPAPRLITKSQHDSYFWQMSYRNFVSYTPSLDEPADGERHEWQVFLRIGAIAAGLGKDFATEPLEGQATRGLIEMLAQNPASDLHGRDLAAIEAETAVWSAPDRMLDVLLRTGPYGDGFGLRSGLTLADLVAAPDGVDLGPLQPRLPEVLRTASGRIELDAPDLVADTERMLESFRSWSPPDVVMVGRRNTRSVNSWTHNVEGLVGGSNRCTFEINPADAARQGIGDGGTMTVRTDVGTITGTAEVTDRVRPGVISAPFGWGHDLPGSRTPVAAAHAGFNFNEVVPFEIDAPSGNAVLNAIPVTISAGDGDRAGAAAAAPPATGDGVG